MTAVSFAVLAAERAERAEMEGKRDLAGIQKLGTHVNRDPVHAGAAVLSEHQRVLALREGSI